MGLIVLHSGHHSKIFRRLLGTTADLKWREAGERERIWVVDPVHPIAEGLGDSFVLPEEEMYGEPFDIPAPDRARLRQLVRGRRDLPQRLLLRARPRPDLLFPARATRRTPTYFDPKSGG